jgi:hypothetical protein
VHAYVLMRNHFHLIVEIPKANLSEFMRQFNISYTGYYNRMAWGCHAREATVPGDEHRGPIGGYGLDDVGARPARAMMRSWAHRWLHVPADTGSAT